ncbi:hypothetical protein G3480_06110 [Thiorhodococcus mannitoliphagus]|uniref:Protein NO VEIN C-terminal domain-containing protein n=1 Tax=Thiorhodococcus mannitoliphagus TaxID=329406 RepID=A0A6P1DV18_9GAMM|nr:hypothetical protein [Thiorhodococcus mannitoliphagus]NEX19892.1 hypothetical protein [Thiorhodococcus mannitoliphagus]
MSQPNQGPDLRTIDRLFSRHLKEHLKLPDSARARDLGAERALIQDYSGRVVYELLQNALDRASDVVLIRWDEASRSLEVANDGRPVSVYPDPKDRRSDFRALLSLHSSSKSADESIGNKGVGFRSVFSLTEEVEVWSRTASSDWWGMRLSHPTEAEPARGVEWSNHEVASFYAPQRLPESSADFRNRFSDYTTVVRLCEMRLDRTKVVAQSIDELMRLPMRFLEYRVRKPRELRIRLDVHSHESGVAAKARDRRIIGDAAEIAVAEASVTVSEAVREQTGLDLQQDACVRVLLFADPGKDARTTNETGLYWSYLPTEQESGFGVHIHADFYLSNSRRNLTLRQLNADETNSAADPAGWNQRLLREAARLIVEELWHRPDVCEREDFWALATPDRCTCKYLAHEVGRRIFAETDEFRQLVARTFPAHANAWLLQRYADFFDALEAWATYTYHHAGGPGWPRHCNRLYEWQALLLDQVEQSGASVLPIVDAVADDMQYQLVPRARPLMRDRRRRDTDRIYLRTPAASHATPILLPSSVQAQGTYVTAWTPPGANAKEPSSHGLLEFSRPEILAHLRPGSTDANHEDLLLAAIRLATEEPNPGRGESILMRARSPNAGPVWRLTLDKVTALGRAGHNLRNLKVPTRDQGWVAASEVARATSGPWPHLDEHALSAICQLSGVASASIPTIDDLCLLLGIGVVPIDDEGNIPGWPEQPSAALGRSLLEAWERDLHPVLKFGDGSLGNKASDQLRSSAWLHDALFDERELLGGRIEQAIGQEAPFAPLAVWWQYDVGGFQTKLLPRLMIRQGETPPSWALDMGVESPLHAASKQRIQEAIKRLTMTPSALNDERDLIALYRRLVDGALRFDPPPPVPLLYRHVDPDGRIRALAWAGPEDRVWDDPGEGASSAFSAFRDVNIWVYRGTTMDEATKLNAIHFAPGAPHIEKKGRHVESELAEQLRIAIWQALPDLLAAAALSQQTFNHEEAIRRQATLIVEHYERVWITWAFDGKEAVRGNEDAGDVFLSPQEHAAPVICFDGSELPLVECAYALSELLTEKRAFGDLFRDGLYAWRQTDSHEDSSPSVLRFRRDHNLSERDVREWRTLLESARLDPKKSTEWCARVKQVLSGYGELAEEPQPGARITPSTWKTANKNVNERDLHNELDEMLAGDPAFKALAPQVEFHAHHQQAFLKHRDKPAKYIAKKAELEGPSHWTESLLAQLRERAQAPVSREEHAQFGWLIFDPDVAWRKRYNLPEADSIEPSKEALQFANGQIALDHLPTTAAKVDLHLFKTEPSTSFRAAISDPDEWMRQSQRKASGGLRAECAVLELAIRQASCWQQNDSKGFQEALDIARPPFKQLAALKTLDLSSQDSIREFLHVASYSGNTGFDVLVPDQASRQVLMVEVKRVDALDGQVVFFLSENERRRAEDYINQCLPWRLWLVASNNAIEDATKVVEKFEAHQAELNQLLTAGLHPGEWMLMATLRPDAKDSSH